MTRDPGFYALCMYPYPSGPAHQGHVRNYTFGDLVVRYRTMLGCAVLSPLGFDSFGLPAENAAIKTGTHPRIFTDERIAELKESLIRLGAVYDWRRELRSHDPSYIRGTQSIFLRLLDAGLAYRGSAPVNWCPGCQTVLANEQVLADGTCERSGDAVVRRDLEQWFFKITAYAEELLGCFGHAGLARAGQDHAAQLDRTVRGGGARPGSRRSGRLGRPLGSGPAGLYDTPRHALWDDVRRPWPPSIRWSTSSPCPSGGPTSRKFAGLPPWPAEIERSATGASGPEAEKRGAFTGSHVLNLFTGQPVPFVCRRLRVDGLRHRGHMGGAGRGRGVPGRSPRPYGLPIVKDGRAHLLGVGGDRGGRGLQSAKAPRSTAGFMNGLAIGPGQGGGH